MRKNLYASETATAHAVAAGVGALEREVDAQGISEAWIVVDSYSNLSGIIADTIGQNAANALAKGKGLRIGKSTTLTAHTSQKLPRAARGAAVLACFPSRKLLDKLDALRDASVLVVIPWCEADITDWVNAHGPEVSWAINTPSRQRSRTQLSSAPWSPFRGALTFQRESLIHETKIQLSTPLKSSTTATSP